MREKGKRKQKRGEERKEREERVSERDNKQEREGVKEEEVWEKEGEKEGGTQQAGCIWHTTLVIRYQPYKSSLERISTEFHYKIVLPHTS